MKKEKEAHLFDNKKSFIFQASGAILILGTIIIALLIYYLNFLPINHFINDNVRLSLAVIKANRGMEATESNVKGIIYLGIYKPAGYSSKTTTILKNLRTGIRKTDSNFRNVFSLLEKHEYNAKGKYSSKLKNDVSKSYLHWKYIEKPILERIIKYHSYLTAGFKTKYLLGYPFSLSEIQIRDILKNTFNQANYLYARSLLIFAAGILFLFVFEGLSLYFLHKNIRNIRKSGSRFFEVFNSSPAIILVLEIESGRIIEANPAAENFYGYTSEEFTSMRSDDLNPFDDRGKLKEFRKRVFEEKSVVASFRHKLKNNEIKTVEARISKLVLGGVTYLLAIIIDITEKKLIEEKLTESEDLFRTLTSTVAIGIVIYKEKVIYANQEALRMSGYAEEELYGKYIWELFVDEDFRNTIKRVIAARLKGEEAFLRNYVQKATTKQGRESWISISASTISYMGQFAGLASFSDVTELANLRNALEKEKDALKTIIDNSPVLVVIYDDKSLLYMNPYAQGYLGYTQEEALNLNPLDVIDAGEDTKKFIRENILKRMRGEIFQENMRLHLKKKDGSLSWANLFASTIFYNNEWVGLGVLTDITGQVKRETEILKERDEMARLSEKDELTGISNRRVFDIRLNDIIKNAPIQNKSFSLILFDIDKFKEFNDAYGHQAGDTILTELSKVIAINLRGTGDFFARFGGEEFMIIIPEGELDKALELAERLRKVIEGHSFSIGEKITISIGVTSYAKGDTSHSITYRADQAMYKAKEKGRNRTETIDSENII